LLFALQFGEPAMRAVAGIARRVPRARLPFLAQISLEWISQDPGPSASVLGGILYGRVAPDHNERRTFQTPALVIGHPRDPLHPFSDAGMLAEELPAGRLIDATSIFELRLKPERLTRKIAAFVEECWEAPARHGAHDEAERAASA
jgi:hypothetical protein